MTTERESGRIPWRLLIASLAAVLALVGLALSIAWRVSTSNELRDQTVKNCRQVELIKVAIVGVLVDSRDSALSRTGDPALRKAITRYYDRQLDRFSPDECPSP